MMTEVERAIAETSPNQRAPLLCSVGETRYRLAPRRCVVCGREFPEVTTAPHVTCSHGHEAVRALRHVRAA